MDLGDPVCLFDSDDQVVLGLRTSLFKVSHISTGIRSPLNGVEGIDTINVDFWMHESASNGPHHSVEIVVPSTWTANLLLCVTKRSVKNSKVISILQTSINGMLNEKMKSINEIHHLFDMDLGSVEQLLINTADLNHAAGGKSK